MSYYKTFHYCAFLYWSSNDDIIVDKAWWEGDALHLLHDDGTLIVIKDGKQRGFVIHEGAAPAKDDGED